MVCFAKVRCWLFSRIRVVPPFERVLVQALRNDSPALFNVHPNAIPVFRDGIRVVSKEDRAAKRRNPSLKMFGMEHECDANKSDRIAPVGE
jgi:hypothetical protein